MPQRSRTTVPEPVPQKQPRGQTATDLMHGESHHLAEAVRGHPHKPAHRTPVAPRPELAGRNGTVEKSPPPKDKRRTMLGLEVAGCPTKAPVHVDVAAEDVNSTCMVMQHATDFKPTPQVIRLPLNDTHKHGPLVGPSIHNTEHDGPRPATDDGLTTQPLPHSHLEHPLSHPTILPTEDGYAGATVERTVPRTHPRRDNKLCSHSNPPTDSNALESTNTSAESPIEARSTTSLPLHTQPPDPWPNPKDQSPLSHPDKAPTCSTSQAAEHPDELLQCSLPGPTARSHFPLLGSKRDKHCNAGRQTQPLHNHVLKPQPTICRIRHALGQARRGGSPVPHQDHISEVPVPSAADTKDSHVMGSPQ